MPGTLDGKVALATALTFAREGAKLVVADMNVDGGRQTVHMITENGGEATFVQVDVSNATEVEAMISKAVETYGRLDCAHNNAGIASGGQRAFTADYPEEKWHQVIAINLTGVWLCRTHDDRGWWVRGPIDAIRLCLTTPSTLQEANMSTLESYVPLIQAEAERLAQFLDTLSTDDLQRPRACELWEIHDVVAHLIWGAQATESS